ncbi:NTP transferase domain-containing protein [bacterium]|nr:NTP transferase domain-containing protein [bacterium]
MKVIIPVAGIGSRLRPHTHTVPKVLIYIAGKPIISYIIDKLKDRGEMEFVLILGYLGDKIREYLLATYPDQKFHFIDQVERKGLGHAIYLAKDVMEDDEEVLIVLGDTIFDTDYKFLKENRSVLAVKKVKDPRRFGVAVTKGESIVKLVEKPAEFISDLALVGIYYIMKWSRLQHSIEHIMENDIKTRGEYQLTDALQQMINDGEDFGVAFTEGWYDCGKPETLLSTNKFLLSKSTEVHSLKSVIVIPPCYIPEDTDIQDSVIGPYVSVGSGSIIRSSIIKNSILDRKSEIYNMNLDNSILGKNAWVKGHSRQLNIGDSSEVEF